MKSKTRAISEGAMMLAMIGVLLIINRQFAGTFELMLFLLSIPIIIYTVKYDMRMGLTLSISSILLSFMFATPTSIFYLISAVMIGLIYAFGILHHWHNSLLLASSVLGNLVVTIITVVIMGAVFGYDLQEEIAMFSKLMPDTNGVDIKQFVTIIVFLSYLGLAILQAISVHIISIELLRRFKIKTIVMKNIFELRFPKWCAPLIIIGFVAYLIVSYIPVDKTVMDVAMIAYCCLLLLSLVDGCLTVICYLRMAKKGKSAIFLALLACFIPIIQNVVSLIGVFDIWEQYRYKMKEGV